MTDITNRPQHSVGTSASPSAQPFPTNPPNSFHGKGSTILWFRNDLRIRDNQALHLANTAEVMVPVYVFDERMYGPTSVTSNGFQRTGPFRARFIKQAVEDLNDALLTRGSRLLVRSGKPHSVLAQIARIILGSGAPEPLRIVAQKEIAYEEVQAEHEVQNHINQECELIFVWGSTLHHPEDFSVGFLKQETTFTQYRKRIDCAVRPEIDVPDRFVPYPEQLDTYQSIIPSLEHDLGVERMDEIIDERAVLTFIGGETYALARLKEFIWDANALPKYKSLRDKSGLRDSSSKLSPWLALGCISPRSVYWEACKYEQNKNQQEGDKQDGETKEAQEAKDSKYWFIFHLMVRDYFRWLAFRTGTKLFGSCTHTHTHEKNESNNEVLNKWISGRTGMRFVDASMRELQHTGYISNRSRQIVASYLINDLKYPDWRAGAEYFEYILVDYDVASNWCNWASLAGALGHSTKRPYRFDVQKQALRHDPHGVYQDLWCPMGAS